MAIHSVSDKPLSELLSLKGRSAIITGAGAGIGRAVALRFAEAGARVMATDIDLAAAEATVARLRGGGHLARALNVTDGGRVAEAAQQAASLMGGVDIWVNLAGIYPVTPAQDITDEEWRRVVAVNFDAAFFGAREAARQMMAGGRGGVIVNTVSTVVHKVSAPGLAAYVSAKGGVEAMTRALAYEFGPSNIRVLSLAPTLTITEGTMAQKASLEVAMGDRGDPHVLYGSRLPLGRVLDGDDVARVALFMVSDLALMMTGSVVYVDGGDRTF